jgi:hypothetical protein
MTGSARGGGMPCAEISDSRFQISDLPPIYQSKTERAGLRRIIAKKLKSEIRKLKSSQRPATDNRQPATDTHLKSTHLINRLTLKVPFFAGNSAVGFYRGSCKTSVFNCQHPREVFWKPFGGQNTGLLRN